MRCIHFYKRFYRIWTTVPSFLQAVLSHLDHGSIISASGSIASGPRFYHFCKRFYRIWTAVPSFLQAVLSHLRCGSVISACGSIASLARCIHFRIPCIQSQALRPRFLFVPCDSQFALNSKHTFPRGSETSFFKSRQSLHRNFPVRKKPSGTTRGMRSEKRGAPRAVINSSLQCAPNTVVQAAQAGFFTVSGRDVSYSHESQASKFLCP
jgi:hypothetical protein